ncbi:MAG: GWxTD domain-containing protein [Bacteroidales bacterium]|nr:GWxTD domain-containing protein [Bacteroidales bacterium]
MKTLVSAGCLFILLFNSSCSTKGLLATQNFAGLYIPEQQFKDLSYTVFNLNDSISRLYYRFPVENLKIKQPVGKAAFSTYKIDYQIYDGYKKGILVDSGSRIVVDSVLHSGMMNDSLRMRASNGKNYLVRVNFTDINAQLSFTQLINLPKLISGLSSDYLLTDEYNIPLMRNYISRAEKVRVRTRIPADTTVHLLQYKFQYPDAAISPYNFSPEGTDEKPEYISKTEIGFQDLLSEPFSLINEGIFTTNVEKDGFKVYRFYDGFPKVSSAVIMRESLRYISTNMEYEELKLLPPKAAVDKFWINLTGTPERALNQLKRYYGRVEAANQYFSISGEGWMSDRGMIYIVFGPPGVVYRNAEVEEWTYGEPGSAQSVRFYFHPFLNSPGIEDYKLIRLDEYRRPWQMAVSNWRR